jgi:hypothetical protein
MSMRVAAVLASALVSSLLVAACDPGALVRNNNTETLEAGFMKHSDLPPPAPTFCYQTLGETDCYADPQGGQGGRLVESYPPRSTLPQPVIQ